MISTGFHVPLCSTLFSCVQLVQIILARCTPGWRRLSALASICDGEENLRARRTPVSRARRGGNDWWKRDASARIVARATRREKPYADSSRGRTGSETEKDRPVGRSAHTTNTTRVSANEKKIVQLLRVRSESAIKMRKTRRDDLSVWLDYRVLDRDGRNFGKKEKKLHLNTMRNNTLFVSSLVSKLNI